MTISAFGVVIPTPGATGTYHFFVIFVLTMDIMQEIKQSFKDGSTLTQLIYINLGKHTEIHNSSILNSTCTFTIHNATIEY